MRSRHGEATRARAARMALLALGLVAAGAYPAAASAAPVGHPASRAWQADEADTLQLLREHEAEIRSLQEHPAVREALRLLEAEEARTVADQVTLTEIPAPPFMEAERGRAFADRLVELGADTVFVDAEGNVVGVRAGTDRGGAGARRAGTVVVSGHLDTVFPEGTDVRVEQRGDTLYAPGIGDDARGLAAVLALLRVMEATGLRGLADIWFVGTVGEEGLGDLRGVKHLFRGGGPSIDAFISIDGARVDRIVNRALGSRRYRVAVEGPGGHSWSAFGLGNPAHALGRAIHRFDGEADRFTSRGPTTSYNVGRIGGGTSVNAIPYEAWMEVDMRSVDQERLLALDSLFRAVTVEAVEEQNAVRREGPPLTANLELVGDRPSGEIPPRTPIVQRAAASARALGFRPTLFRSSTDANVPISLGIPAVTIGGGGEGGGAHSLDEWWRDPGDAHRGVQRALLLLLAEAGLGAPEPRLAPAAD